MWVFVVGSIVTLVFSIPISIALYTLLLAVLTHFNAVEKHCHHTSLYVGRVSHTRLRPVIHDFHYPLFMFAIDLEEFNEKKWDTMLWPLSTVMRFRSSDHFKNNQDNNDDDISLLKKVFTLARTNTNGVASCSRETHRVVLLTHLSYYGYCFNPVSIYYILEKASSKIDAIVLEVSNTPWNEMHSYVLHPSSIQVQQVVVPTKDDCASIHCIFPKAFHVSPFMEMEYMYDWAFFHKLDPISILAAMKTSDGDTQFTASVELSRVASLTPLRMAWQLIQFPMYCLVIQVWIHVEAFWLFCKGVAYQPHPDGSETTASRIIASIMTPLFALKDWLHVVSNRDAQEKKD